MGPGRRGELPPRGQGRPRRSGRGRTRARGKGRIAKGVKRGPRKAIEPSLEFKILLSQASNAFIDHDYEKAITDVQNAIQLNPEQFAAHSLLSEIFLAQRKPDKAVAALFNGAHTRHTDPKIWLTLAKMILENVGDDRTKALHDVIYCYSRIIDVDGRNFHMRFQRAMLHRELGSLGKALKEYKWILTKLPHDTRTLRLITEVSIESNNVKEAKDLWEESINHFLSQPVHDESKFGWSDVNVYVELFGYSGEYTEGISQLKKLSRWLLGRGDDNLWEDVEDDREFDLEDSPRRVTTLGFIAEKFPKSSYGQGLPLELRIKLGRYRLKLCGKHIDEAYVCHLHTISSQLVTLTSCQSHFGVLNPEDLSPNSLVFDFADLFIEVAQSLADAGLYKEALRYYAPIEGMDEYASAATVLMAMAKCYRSAGMLTEAERCNRQAVTNDEKSIEARVQFAKLLEDMKRPEEAYQFVSEAVILEREKLEEQSGKATRSVRKSLVQLNNMQQRVRLNRVTRVHAENLQSFAEMPSHRSQSAVEDSTTSTPPPAPTPDISSFNALSAGRPRGKRKVRLLLNDPTSPASHPRKAPPPLDPEIENDETILDLYNRLLTSQDAMRTGDPVARENWLDAADTLLRDFRSNRIFYPWERHQKFLGYSKDALRQTNRRKHIKESEASQISAAALNNMAERLHSTISASGHAPVPQHHIPTTYRGLSFNTWLSIFLEYAFENAKLHDRHEAYEALTAATDANVFWHSKPSMSQIHIVYFTCALLLSDEETLMNISRVFISGGSTAHNLTPSTPKPTHNPPASGASTQPVRHQSLIYAILARLHAHKNPTSWYNAGPNQKYILRQIKQMDTHLSATISSLPPTVSSATREATIASTFDLPLVLMYGHVLSTASSHTNALAYYLRCYAVAPSHPLVLLSTALAYIHWALKRQAGNRHYLILQGSFFLQKYLSIRSNSTHIEEKIEAEFNVGRAWHMLSLNDLAVSHYEKVLQLGREMKKRNVAIKAAKKAVAGGLSIQEMVNKAGAAFFGESGVDITLTAEEMALAERKIAAHKEFLAEAEAQKDDGVDQEEEDDGGEDYTREAAMALTQIYAGNGSIEKAREITHQWLKV
jgi:general transcription factor 3C polypeptide 3 (transcription factor C subunit 4)